MRNRIVSDATAALARAQASSGGWGWRHGQPANTECTALAMWALHAQPVAGGMAGAAAAGGRAWLRSWQKPDGSWPMGEQVPDSSWMSSLAVLALARFDPQDEQAIRGAEWLLGQRSRGYPWLLRLRLRLFPAERTGDQDSTLVGWGWTSDSTAWVEPTAWALLATKQLAARLPRESSVERVRQAHLMLADRMCSGGGWNYGNKTVMGEDLAPYPDTTALALLALHDAPSEQVTGVSRGRLHEMMAHNRTTLVLALSVLSLQLYGEDVAPLRAALLQRMGTSDATDDVRTTALALLALDEREAHFEVSRGA